MDKRFIDKTGGVFGMLTVLRYDGFKTTPKGKKRFYWWCKCQCGKEKSVNGMSISNGDTISCGCEGLRRRTEASKTHGLTNSKAYNSWRGMIERCSNSKNRQFKDYGGRGITVCERWKLFDNFIADMGHPPDGFSIDRKKSHLGYFAGNCAWASATTQARNKRNNRIIEFDGVSKCMAEWAQILGLTYAALQTRLDRGWSIERAFKTPPHKLLS